MWLSIDLKICDEGYGAVDVATGEIHKMADLVNRLPWKHNELAPHEPRMPPHEYVLRDWLLDDLLTSFVILEFIVQKHPESYDAYFRGYQHPMRYLEFGDRRCWRTRTKKWFLNRCFLDSVEPPRKVSDGARPIPLSEWGASLPYWPRGSGYGEWRKEKGKWVFYRSQKPVHCC